MENLKDALSKFKGASNETELQTEFRKLAPIFLYGGYIDVRGVYKVYIKTVEFYFHSEEEKGIHDPIVYHRNGRDLENVPYFPLMTLHAHNSGFDITFESEAGKYRASALIRSYEVKDKAGKYLIWNTENKRFVSQDKYGFNKQSTYLYALLNGYSLNEKNDIKWQPDNTIKQSKEPSEDVRKNVFESESEWEYKPLKVPKAKLLNRKWSFTREDQL
ncbi:MAG: hypothetical protein J6Y72_12305 [Bacteroidales bacterium]|nr:hypothetical protein [Bacteroidales bacterium]